MVSTASQLRGLILSGLEVKELNPEWSDIMVEAWLNLFENFVQIADVIDNTDLQGMEQIAENTAAIGQIGAIIDTMNKATVDVNEKMSDLEATNSELLSTVNSQEKRIKDLEQLIASINDGY